VNQRASPSNVIKREENVMKRDENVMKNMQVSQRVSAFVAA
jgi:hypothetical protein